MSSPPKVVLVHGDPDEDHHLLQDPHWSPTVDHVMETDIRPFFPTPPARPHQSTLTGYTSVASRCSPQLHRRLSDSELAVRQFHCGSLHASRPGKRPVSKSRTHADARPGKRLRLAAAFL